MAQRIGLDIDVMSDSARARRDLAQLNRSVGRIEKTSSRVTRGFRNMALSLAGVVTAGAGLRGLGTAADTMTNLENKLKAVARSGQDVEKMQLRLSKIASRSRAPVRSAVSTYQRMAMAMDETQASASELNRVTETLLKSGTLSGSAPAEIQRALVQFSQAASTGVLRAEEMNSIIENAPLVLKVAAKEMGVSMGELIAAVRDPQIEVEFQQIFDAVLAGSSRIDKQFKGLSTTVAQGWVVFKDGMNAFFGSFIRGTGLASSLGDSLLGLGDKLTALSNKAQAWGENISLAFKVVGRSAAFLLDGLKTILGGLASVIGSVLSGEDISAVMSRMVSKISDSFRSLYSKVQEPVKALVDMVIGWFEWLSNVLVGNSIVPDQNEAIVQDFAELPEKILKALGRLGDSLIGFFIKIMTNVRNSLSGVFNKYVTPVFSSVVTKIKDLFSLLPSFIKEPLTEAAKRVRTFLFGLSLDARFLFAGIQDKGVYEGLIRPILEYDYISFGKELAHRLGEGIKKNLTIGLSGVGVAAIFLLRKYITNAAVRGFGTAGILASLFAGIQRSENMKEIARDLGFWFGEIFTSAIKFGLGLLKFDSEDLSKNLSGDSNFLLEFVRDSAEGAFTAVAEIGQGLGTAVSQGISRADFEGTILGNFMDATEAWVDWGSSVGNLIGEAIIAGLAFKLMAGGGLATVYKQFTNYREGQATKRFGDRADRAGSLVAGAAGTMGTLGSFGGFVGGQALAESMGFDSLGEQLGAGILGSFAGGKFASKLGDALVDVAGSVRQGGFLSTFGRVLFRGAAGAFGGILAYELSGKLGQSIGIENEAGLAAFQFASAFAAALVSPALVSKLTKKLSFLLTQAFAAPGLKSKLAASAGLLVGALAGGLVGWEFGGIIAEYFDLSEMQSLGLQIATAIAAGTMGAAATSRLSMAVLGAVGTGGKKALSRLSGRNPRVFIAVGAAIASAIAVGLDKKMGEDGSDSLAAKIKKGLLNAAVIVSWFVMMGASWPFTIAAAAINAIVYAISGNNLWENLGPAIKSGMKTAAKYDDMSFWEMLLTPEGFVAALDTTAATAVGLVTGDSGSYKRLGEKLGDQIASGIDFNKKLASLDEQAWSDLGERLADAWNEGWNKSFDLIAQFDDWLSEKNVQLEAWFKELGFDLGGSWVDGFREAITGIDFSGLGTPEKVNPQFKDYNMGRPLKKADGGYISGAGGPRSDSIPAMLSNGEYVINAEATRKFRPLLESINGGGKAFANGGPVDRSNYSIKPVLGSEQFVKTQTVTIESGELRMPEVARKVGKTGVDALDNAVDTGLRALGMSDLAFSKIGNKLDMKSGFRSDKARNTVSSDETRSPVSSGAGAVKRIPENGGPRGLSADSLPDATSRVSPNYGFASKSMAKYENTVSMLTSALEKGQIPFDKFVDEVDKAAEVYNNSEDAARAYLAEQKKNNREMAVEAAREIKSSFQQNLTGLLSGELSIKDSIHGFLDTLTMRILDTFASSLTNAVWDTLGLDKIFENMFNNIANSLSGSVSKGLFGGGGGGLLGGLFGGGGGILGGSLFNIGMWADGGRVTGPGGPTDDRVPAMLSNGEYVVRASQAAKFMPVLESINSGKPLKFSEGGLVSPSANEMPKRVSSRKNGNEGSNGPTKFEINIQGDVSEQTRREVMKMIGDITNGVNSVNRERGIQ